MIKYILIKQDEDTEQTLRRTEVYSMEALEEAIGKWERAEEQENADAYWHGQLKDE